MKMTRFAVIFIFLLAFSFCACSSSKNLSKSEETVLSEKKMPVLATGILRETEEGSFCIITGEKTKNRATYALCPLEGHETVFHSLSDFVGKSVSVSGFVIEKKNKWFMSVGVLSVTAGEN